MIFSTFPSTDVSRNRLAKISGRAFVNLSNLTYLDISYNKLSALELDYMCHLPRLQTLNISGNIQMNLLDVRPVFQNLTELRSLSIADITNMPLGIFVPLSNLQMLNISGTHLNNETLQILNPLAKLKVSYDSFQSEYHIRTSYIMQKYIHVNFFHSRLGSFLIWTIFLCLWHSCQKFPKSMWINKILAIYFSLLELKSIVGIRAVIKNNFKNIFPMSNW